MKLYVPTGHWLGALTTVPFPSNEDPPDDMRWTGGSFLQFVSVNGEAWHVAVFFVNDEELPFAAFGNVVVQAYQQAVQSSLGHCMGFLLRRPPVNLSILTLCVCTQIKVMLAAPLLNSLPCRPGTVPQRGDRSYTLCFHKVA